MIDLYSWPAGQERVVDIKAFRALAPSSLRPRSQAITPPAPHAASPLEPQAQMPWRVCSPTIAISGFTPSS
jgi:hypothetical protein